MGAVDLPDDVLTDLLSRMGLLAQMRLSIATKRWRSVLDIEERWWKMWFAADIVLNRASLAACPTFKARIALATLAQSNMSAQCGSITPLVSNVRFRPGSYSTVDIRGCQVHAGSRYVRYAVTLVESYSSYNNTQTLRHDVIDLERWPEVRHLELQRSNPPPLCLVGTKYMRDQKYNRLIHLENVWATADKGTGMPAAFPASTPIETGNCVIYENSDAAFPWLLCTPRRTTGGVGPGSTKSPSQLPLPNLFPRRAYVWCF